MYIRPACCAAHALPSTEVASKYAVLLIWMLIWLTLPPAAVAAKSAGKTSQGGVVWPPGQPSTTKAGRLVFNTNIHGTVFNTAAGKAKLTQFMELLRTSTAAVFPPRTFGRMALAPGYSLRLVDDPAFPCTCKSACGGWL